MATLKKFEDLERWQLARMQGNEFYALLSKSAPVHDFALRNQVKAASASVMDNIAQDFERSGNREFKNFPGIAKESNGECRLQLCRCPDRGYVATEKFDQLRQNNLLIGNKPMPFAAYLQNSIFQRPKPQAQFANFPTATPLKPLKPSSHETR